MGCVDTTVATSTADSCITTSLTNGVPYYFKIFAKDSNGNYSTGIVPSGSSAIPNPVTTITTGFDPSNVTIAPGATATTSNAFTLQTSSGSDVITSLTVSVSNASSTSLIEVTNDAGSFVYGSVANPTGTTTTISLSTNITATTVQTGYKIRITPKTHNILLTSVLYTVQTYVLSWSGTNTNKSGTDTSSTTITIDNVEPDFLNAFLSYATGVNPYASSISDFNADGKKDIVTVNWAGASVSIFLGNGDGTFQSKIDYAVGSQPFDVSVQDFNMDNKQDIAVVNGNSSTTSILLGNGDGTFQTKVDYVTGPLPISLAINTFNNDSVPDIVVANHNSNTVSVFIGNGDGTFQPKVDYVAGSQSRHVKVSDFNADGEKDIVVANGISNTVSVLLGNGDGTFQTKVDYITGSLPISISLNDFNNDGVIDISVANYLSNTISLLLGNGDGTFDSKVDYVAGMRPFSISSSDFNIDSKIDIVVSNYSSSTISTFFGNGDGTFQDKIDRKVKTGVTGISVSDLDEDNKPDIVVANDSPNSFSILLHTGNIISSVSESTKVTLSYLYPVEPDLESIIVLTSSSIINDVPVEGTLYTVGDSIGSSIVSCIDTNIDITHKGSCLASSLANETLHHFKVFAKDIYGNYSVGIIPSNSPIFLHFATTIETGTDPSSTTVSPGSGTVLLNSFTLQTDGGTEVISSMLLAIANASSTSLVEVTNDAGTVVYGSVSNPTGTTTTVTLSPNIVANTTQTQYKIRITPKPHGNLPTGSLSMSYPVHVRVFSWSGTNFHVGQDSTSATVTIDNEIQSTTHNTAMSWQTSTSAADNAWISVVYGNGLFVAVSNTGTGNRVMTSPDGITWTIRTSAADNTWYSVTYGNGLFVAVGGFGTGNRVMTSPNGITWTIRTSAADNTWYSVTYGNGLFVAVTSSAADNRVMTSPDGIVWTVRTGTVDNSWNAVTYGNGLFVAVASSGTGNRVMTSPDGITWTPRTSAADSGWQSVTYGNGIFVAVARSGTGNRVMTSLDGITWNGYTAAVANIWYSVTYGNGLFVAVAQSGTGDRVMTSLDGITWNSRTSATDRVWSSVTYGNGLFVSVSQDGTSNRVMISTSTLPALTPGNAQVAVTYTTPNETDLHSMVILRSSSPITDRPQDGSTYSAGNTIGGSTVACVDTTVTKATIDICMSTGVVNGLTYHYKVFAKDTHGNYSTGLVPEESPVTPSAGADVTQVNSYIFRKDDGGESSATAYVPENNPVTADFIQGDLTRLRFVISNQGSSKVTKAYQLEYATTTSPWTPVPVTEEATTEHFRVDSSRYVNDEQTTAHLPGLTQPSGKAFRTGSVKTARNKTNFVPITTTEYTEIEYNVRSTATAVEETNYQFRVTNLGDPTGFVYLVTPTLSMHDKVFRRGAGGGASRWNVSIEAPSTATTTVTGGGASSNEATSTLEVSAPPAPQQSTTTPTRRRGGGGNVGLAPTIQKPTLYAYSTENTPSVLGAYTSSDMCTNITQILYSGLDDTVTDNNVSLLQLFLQQRGYYTMPITGYFRTHTKKAVEAYQRDNNLIVTGIVGKVTGDKIYEESCGEERGLGDY